ncbi:MAG: HAMP domain-containing protein [Acidimicrobiales bacterium]|nr:HAMP domain-containing protein [Acidimicrobiales bacterium]
MTAWVSKLGRMSFRTRLGTFTALAVGLTVAMASLAAYFVVHHQLYTQVDSALTSDMASAPQLSGDLGQINPTRLANFLRQSNGGFVQVLSPDGTVVFSSLVSPPLRVGPAEGSLANLAVAERAYRFDTGYFDGVRYRLITQGGGYVYQGSPAALQIGRPLTDVNHTLATLRLILWLVTLGGIAAAIALGYIIGRTTIRPVERLTAAAEHVAATQNLDSTITEEGDDELTRLARAFNSMLVALAASRQQQAQLISDAGHELRTPLTSLRTNFEVLMRMRDLPEADRSELARDVEAQLEELTNLIGDVVDLARQEEKQPEPIEVRLDAIVERAVERARRRAPALTFETHITPGSVRAQPALLERAVLNVLDNAAKWSPPGATVEVWLQRGAWWSLDIHDHGPGIAPEDLPHVFDRFYRAPTARSMPGSGLGLAIVHQVITNHGGTVSASVPPEGGTLVHIELPIVAESEPDKPDRAGSPPPYPAPLPINT